MNPETRHHAVDLSRVPKHIQAIELLSGYKAKTERERRGARSIPMKEGESSVEYIERLQKEGTEQAKRAARIDEAIAKAYKNEGTEELMQCLTEIVAEGEASLTNAKQLFEQFQKQNPEAKPQFDQITQARQEAQQKLGRIQNPHLKRAWETYIQALEGERQNTAYYHAMNPVNQAALDLQNAKKALEGVSVK